MSETSIETKWDDNEVFILLPKKVRFTHPPVTSSRRSSKKRPEEYKKCFFSRKELKMLQEDRQSRIYEEQFETVKRGSEVEITFPVRRIEI